MQVPRLNSVTDWYRRNRVLTWMCVVIAVNQLGFGSIVPIVPLYAAEFGVSQTLIGLTIAVYGLARFLASVPAGWTADKAGRRWALAVGGFVTIFGNLLCGLAGNFEIFLLGRFVAGTGAAMVLTGGQIILADITTRENRGRTMAIYMSVFLFAVGIGPLPGGYLAEWGGLAFPFFVYSVLGGAVTMLAIFRVPETRERRDTTAGVEVTQPGFISQVRLVSGQTAFLLVALVSFASFFARTGALFNLIPQRAENQMGLQPGQIGLGLASISIVSLIVAYPSGVLVDRFGRKSVIVPATLISGVGLVMFALAPDFGWFLGSCLVWALAAGISGSAPAAYAADMAPSGQNASAMGTYRMLSDSGYVFGPAILGWTADLFGTNLALYGTALFVIICGLAFARYAPESHRRESPSRATAGTAAD